MGETFKGMAGNNASFRGSPMRGSQAGGAGHGADKAKKSANAKNTNLDDGDAEKTTRKKDETPIEYEQNTESVEYAAFRN